MYEGQHFPRRYATATFVTLYMIGNLLGAFLRDIGMVRIFRGSDLLCNFGRVAGGFLLYEIRIHLRVFKVDGRRRGLLLRRGVRVGRTPATELSSSNR